jgi:hypothetical protein
MSITIKPTVDFTGLVCKHDDYLGDVPVLINEFRGNVTFKVSYSNPELIETRSDVADICKKLGIEIDWSDAIATFKQLSSEHKEKQKQEMLKTKQALWDKKYPAIETAIRSASADQMSMTISPTKEKYMESKFSTSLVFAVEAKFKGHDFTLREVEQRRPWHSGYRASGTDPELPTKWSIWDPSAGRRGGGLDLKYASFAKALAKGCQIIEGKVQHEIEAKKSKETFLDKGKYLSKALGRKLSILTNYDGQPTGAFKAVFRSDPMSQYSYDDMQVSFSAQNRTETSSPEEQLISISKIDLSYLTIDDMKALLAIMDRAIECKRTVQKVAQQRRDIAIAKQKQEQVEKGEEPK